MFCMPVIYVYIDILSYDKIFYFCFNINQARSILGNKTPKYCLDLPYRNYLRFHFNSNIVVEIEISY